MRSIISQTNTFNIVPVSVPLNSVRRTLKSLCVRKTDKYIPQFAFWISRLFIELAIKNSRVRLTLDCSLNNINGPGIFRTDADKPDFQVCYFDVLNEEQLYNEYISKQINNFEDNENIQFKIIHLKSKINKEETFDATEELRTLIKDGSGSDRTNEKRRARSVFNILNKKIVSELESIWKSRARPKFLFGR